LHKHRNGIYKESAVFGKAKETWIVRNQKLADGLKTG